MANFNGTSGDDTIVGTDGDDSITAQRGNDLIVAGDGNDTIFAGNGSIEGTDNDTIDGGAGDDSIRAFSGDDSIIAGAGNDSIDGGTGNDTLDYSANQSAVSIVLSDVISATLVGTVTSTDTDVDAFNSVETFILTDQDDVYDARAQNSPRNVTIDFGAGDDQIFANFAAGEFDGGDGIDTIYIDVPGTYTIDLDAELMQGRQLSNVENVVVDGSFVNLTGSDVDNLLVASGTGSDFINGLGGDDTINGGAGDNDTLIGGDGHDLIINEAGNASLTGGQGDDTLQGHTGPGHSTAVYTDAGGAVLVDLQSGLATGADGNDTLVDINGVEGSAFDDTITGSDRDDSLLGGDGDDEIDGGLGNDTLRGEGGADSLDGGDGNDLLDGGLGNDDLHGGDGDDDVFAGAGDDFVAGGTGRDTLRGDDGDDTLTGGAGNDELRGGDGNDTFVLADGSGSDAIVDFDLADDDGDGFTNDQFDVSGLMDAEGNPVNAWDVTVSTLEDDPNFGGVFLSFPNGETVFLEGVTTDQVDTAQELNAMGIPCYVKGTLINTTRGEVPVEDLRMGDHVRIHGGGSFPILWINSTKIDEDQLLENPNLHPIRVKPFAFENSRALLVSPQHCLVLYSDDGPVFAKAKHVAQYSDYAHVAHGRTSVEYYHLLLPKHAVICANGLWSESFYPGAEAMKVLSSKHKADLIRAIGARNRDQAILDYGPRALPVARRGEVQALVSDTLARSPSKVAA